MTPLALIPIGKTCFVNGLECIVLKRNALSTTVITRHCVDKAFYREASSECLNRFSTQFRKKTTRLLSRAEYPKFAKILSQYPPECAWWLADLVVTDHPGVCLYQAYAVKPSGIVRLEDARGLWRGVRPVLRLNNRTTVSKEE